MPVLPFHKYLGPGNDLNSGDPVDEDDRIAQEHDSAYATALTAEDISNADSKAINEFWNDFSTTGNTHSLIGAAGLTLKQSVEKYTGVLYPDMSTHRHKYKALSLKSRGEERSAEQKEARQNEQNVRRDRMQSSTQPSTSHDVSDIGQDETQSDQPMDQLDAPVTENGGLPPSGGVQNPNNNISTLYMDKSVGSPGFTFFKKSRLMHTWGFTSSKFNRGATNRVSDYLAYNTSLAYIPVDWIPFYLSPAEYEMLPIGSYIKEVYVEIIPKGVRCSFDTGTTITSSANSMHVIYGKHCIGLNHKVECVNLKLNQKADKPMVIDTVSEIDKNEFTNRFYGDAAQFHSADNVQYPCSWGANRALPYYACIMTSTNVSNKNAWYIKTGWPRLDNIIEKYNLNEHINVPCIKYNYKPKNGILKNFKHSAVVPNKIIPLTGHVDMVTKGTQYLENNAFVRKDVSGRPNKDNIFAYENIVDKAHLLHHPNLQSSLRSQPQVHVGIEPVQSNAPSDTDPAFVNASAEYEIKSTCVIGFNSNLMYANDTYGSKLSFSAGYQDTNQHYYLSQNHVGGFYCYNWTGKYDTRE